MRQKSQFPAQINQFDTRIEAFSHSAQPEKAYPSFDPTDMLPYLPWVHFWQNAKFKHFFQIHSCVKNEML